jgi:hypothetical protein
LSRQGPRQTDGTGKLDNKPDASGNHEMLDFGMKAKVADDKMRELLFKHHRQRYGESKRLGTDSPRAMIRDATLIQASSPIANF